MSVHTCQCRCVPHVEDHCRNGEPDFPPEVIEKAARAYRAAWHEADAEPGDKPEGYRSEAGIRAALAAVADWMNDCDAEALRRNTMHDRLVQEARVEGARQVRDAVETLIPSRERVRNYHSSPWVDADDLRDVLREAEQQWVAKEAGA